MERGEDQGEIFSEARASEAETIPVCDAPGGNGTDTLSDDCLLQETENAETER